jgi:hypothetical protein
MSRRKEQVMNNQIARDIFNELDLYAKDKQFYPPQNALFKYMTESQFNRMTRRKNPARYSDLSQGKFNYWFSRLVEEKYIEIDPITRAIRCIHLAIVERDDVPYVKGEDLVLSSGAINVNNYD